jgi:hypothetical protein
MIPAILMFISAGIILALGCAHLWFTFNGPRLRPRDPALQAHMERDTPGITRQTTMWKAWVGFNASHSMGAILFGLVYGFLAVRHRELLFDSPFLLAVGAAMLCGFLILGRLYWFRTPFTGIALALACYVASLVASSV